MKTGFFFSLMLAQPSHWCHGKRWGLTQLYFFSQTSLVKQAAAAASSESCEVDWVTLMQPLAATLQQVPKFFLLGSQEERDSNALDADVSTLGRLAVEVQVFATPNMKALAKFVLELISVAEKFAGRSA